jgi:hypothetical protein
VSDFKKIDSKTSILLAFWAVFMLPPHLCAQNLAKFEKAFSFKYGEKMEYDGEVKVVFQYRNKDESAGTLIQGSAETASLNFDNSSFDGEFLMRITNLKFDKNKHEKEYALVITSACIDVNDRIKKTKSDPIQVGFSENKLPENADREIKFRVVDNGYGTLKIGFGIVKKTANISEWNCENGKIKLDFAIKGIKKEEIKAVIIVNKDSLAWLDCRPKGIDGWKKYLADWPNGQYKSVALELIGKETKPTKTPVSAPVESTVSSEEKQWALVQKSRTLADVQQFLAAFPNGKRFAQAELLQEELLPLDIQMLGSEGSKTVTILHANNPKYKDISLNDGLEIDDSRLLSEKILQVQYNRSGRYRILIKDDWGKSDTLNFDNKLSASLAADSNQLVFTINGGKKPYKIEFFNAETNQSVWSLTNVLDRKKVFFKDSLARQLGVKSLIAKVSDGDGGRAFEIVQAIQLPVFKKSIRWWPWLLGLVIFGLGGVTFWQLQKRKRYQATTR